MSYARAMGDTASDIARAIAAGAGAALTAATSSGATTSSNIDPTTGLPYGAINPATGMPYGAIDPTTGLPYGTAAASGDSSLPLIIGGLAVVGIVGFLVMRRSRSTPNRRRRHGRRRVRRNYDYSASHPYKYDSRGRPVGR